MRLYITLMLDVSTTSEKPNKSKVRAAVDKYFSGGHERWKTNSYDFYVQKEMTLAINDENGTDILND